MGRHSFLGPIHPQFDLQTEAGRIAAPAHAILQQFRTAQRQCKAHPQLLPSWLPILRQYGPALLVQCQFQNESGRVSLVSDWLKKYMFAGLPDAEEKAKAIAATLNNHKLFKTRAPASSLVTRPRLLSS